jgi:hypothetical protein
MSKTTAQKRKERQEELLKLFEGDFYQEKKVGDKWHVKQYNRNTDRWQVAVYSESSFSRYKGYVAQATFGD